MSVSRCLRHPADDGQLQLLLAFMHAQAMPGGARGAGQCESAPHRRRSSSALVLESPAVCSRGRRVSPDVRGGEWGRLAASFSRRRPCWLTAELLPACQSDERWCLGDS